MDKKDELKKGKYSVGFDGETCLIAQTESDNATVTILAEKKANEPARPIIEYITGLLNTVDFQKDQAYSERNKLVALLASLFPSSLERHPDSDKEWEDDWRWIVFIDLPTGQVSWHIHDSELKNFNHVQSLKGRTWDGHTTDQKYERCSNVYNSPIFCWHCEAGNGEKGVYYTKSSGSVAHICEECFNKMAGSDKALKERYIRIVGPKYFESNEEMAEIEVLNCSECGQPYPLHDKNCSVGENAPKVARYCEYIGSTDNNGLKVFNKLVSDEVERIRKMPGVDSETPLKIKIQIEDYDSDVTKSENEVD